jgi:tetrahydromethanopterin S-methyltransferase subunit F
VGLGVLASLALIVEDLLAAAQLLGGAHHPNAGMVAAGIAVGLVAAALFLWQARAFLRPPGR